MPNSTRLASARLNVATVNIAVVAAYGPTLKAEELANSSFYDDLQDAISSASLADMLIVVGGWNARPGTVDMTSLLMLANLLKA